MSMEFKPKFKPGQRAFFRDSQGELTPIIVLKIVYQIRWPNGGSVGPIQEENLVSIPKDATKGQIEAIVRISQKPK